MILRILCIHFICITSANAGLISLSINGGVTIPASGGPGGQGYTLTTPEVGTVDSALFVAIQSQSLCNSTENEDTPSTDFCRAASNANVNMIYSIAVQVNDAGIEHFTALGQSQFSVFYDAIAYGGIIVDGEVGGRAGSGSGGSATWGGSLTQNGATILSANNRPEWSESRRVERIMNVNNVNLLTFTFNAFASTNARLGPGSWDAYTSFSSFVYVDPVFSIADDLAEFVDIEVASLDYKRVVYESGVDPFAVTSPGTFGLFTLGTLLLFFRKYRYGN